MATRCTEVKEPIQFIIGDNGPNTPAVNASSYINKDLKFDRYLIHRNNKGFLHEDVHFTRRGDGGFDLIPSDEFGSQEEFTLIPF